MLGRWCLDVTFCPGGTFQVVAILFVVLCLLGPMFNLINPDIPAEVGFSCQTHLAVLVNDFLHPGQVYCWYATELNPFGNGDSSNPVLLYVTIDRAVKAPMGGDEYNTKIKDIRTNLMRAIQKEMKGRVSNSALRQAIKLIATAELKCFRPQLWRLKLDRIEPMRVEAGKFSDEHLVRDLTNSEFDVIVK